VLVCPYCKKETEVAKAAGFATIDASRATCQRCHKEFVIIKNVPMTKQQYRQSMSQ